MATGIKAAGADLDSIFAVRVHTKIADVLVKSNGSVDLSNRFEGIVFGSGPSATGIKKAGTDLNALFAALGSLGSVIITGYASSHTDPPGTTRSGIAFQLDGSIDDIGPGLSDRTQVQLGEWWSGEPSAGIGNNYDIRCASLVSGTWTFQAESVGTYIQISQERRWRVDVLAMDNPDNKQCTGLFEIRPTGGGAVLDSANHSGDATN